MAPINHVFNFLDFLDPIWQYLYKKRIFSPLCIYAAAPLSFTDGASSLVWKISELSTKIEGLQAASVLCVYSVLLQNSVSFYWYSNQFYEKNHVWNVKFVKNISAKK